MEEEHPSISMARTGKIIRISVHKFLQHYQYFTSIATFLALPFSISVLISQISIPRSFSLYPIIYGRLHSVFHAAGFPPSSDFFAIVSLKLSQTISSFIVTFPFTLSFLLLSKASIINFLKRSSSNPSWISIYGPLLSTHLCNSFVIFSANATTFSLIFMAFNFLDGFHITSAKWVLLLSAISAVIYSIILANALVICNLALISSGVEGRGGFMEILRACVMIRGRTSTALAMAVPINLGFAAIEALFHFRIITTHDPSRNPWMVVFEGILIAYLYSIFIVLDVIMSCMFYQSCQRRQIQEIDIEEYYQDDLEKLKGFDDC